MRFKAFGDEKDIMEWLEDPRIHPELTRDVLFKRVRRNQNTDTAVTTPVIKGAGVGDTKQRIEARNKKLAHRVKMFKLAQKVREEWDKGVAVEEIMDRHGLSRSQVNKMGSKNEWYNIHWSKYGKVPDHFKNLKTTVLQPSKAKQSKTLELVK